MKLVSLHTNTWGCGIAKYNHELSSKLNIELISLNEWLSRRDNNAILSIGLAEFTRKEYANLIHVINDNKIKFHLILHSLNESKDEILFSKAISIVSLNNEILNELNQMGYSSVLSYTPSLIPSIQDNSGSNHFKLFTFGMAHKQELANVEKLINRIRSWGKCPELYISSAVHIGEQPLDSLLQQTKGLSKSLDVRVNFLGFLSDEKLVKEMKSCGIAFRFYKKGIRSNSTTALTALQNSMPLVTNLDEFSPKWLKHLYNVVDINSFMDSALEPEWNNISKNGFTSYTQHSNWEGIISRCKELYNFNLELK